MHVSKSLKTSDLCMSLLTKCTFAQKNTEDTAYDTQNEHTANETCELIFTIYFIYSLKLRKVI